MNEFKKKVVASNTLLVCYVFFVEILGIVIAVKQFTCFYEIILLDNDDEISIQSRELIKLR